MSVKQHCKSTLRWLSRILDLTNQALAYPTFTKELIVGLLENGLRPFSNKPGMHAQA